MRMLSMLFIGFMAFSQAVLAKPIQYAIAPANSMVGFSYQFGADTIQGQFPNYTANISIDFEKAANSHVDVILKTDTAKAGFLFATQAVRSKKILYTEKFPGIRFVSKSVKADGANAVIQGMITVRGITKPLTLNAQLLRDPGTQASERDNLRIRLTGEINRNDFDAGGYAKYVGPTLTIQIDARIKRKK